MSPKYVCALSLSPYGFSLMVFDGFFLSLSPSVSLSLSLSLCLSLSQWTVVGVAGLSGARAAGRVTSASGDAFARRPIHWRRLGDGRAWGTEWSWTPAVSNPATVRQGDRHA